MGLKINRDRLCLIQISIGDGNAILVQFDGQDYSAINLKRLLLNKKIKKIFHFARFDIAVIQKYLNTDIENIFCTKIASKLTRTYSDKHGLKELCQEVLGVNISKQQQSSYWGAKDLTKEQKKYAAQDVVYLHELMRILVKRLQDLDRFDIAMQIFSFLSVRAKLDLIGWDDIDVFAHH